jgi:hypothetical protein
MAEQNDKQERLKRDDSERGQADWGDSGRSEDWTDNNRYGERKSWDADESYGSDWQEHNEEGPKWERSERDPANTPNPEAMTSGQSGTDGEQVEDSSPIKPEMFVYDRDGEPFGVVKEVRQKDILVDRPSTRDLYVPLEVCRVEQDRVRLSLSAEEIEKQPWEMLPVIATPLTGGNAGMREELRNKDEGERS